MGGRCPIVVIHKLCVDQPRVNHTTSCLLNVTVSSSWIRYYKKDLQILRRAPPPSRLPSRLPDVTHVSLSPRTSPSVFILEAIINWRRERPGNEASIWMFSNFSGAQPHSQSSTTAITGSNTSNITSTGRDDSRGGLKTGLGFDMAVIINTLKALPYFNTRLHLCIVNMTEASELGYSIMQSHRHSLVPRSFPSPVFDHLQYAKMEREGLGAFIT